MIIDSITGRTGISIDRLTVPEPRQRPDVPFDPEFDLPHLFWESAENYLEMGRESVFGARANFTIDEWSLFARKVFLLSPQKKDKLGIDEGMRQRLFAKIDKVKHDGSNPNGLTFLQIVADAKILYPEHISDLVLDSKTFQFVTDAMMDDFGPMHSSEKFRERMVNATIVFPNQRNVFLGLVDDYAAILKSDLDWYWQRKQWQAVASKLSTLRLVCGEQTESLGPNEWTDARKDLGKLVANRLCYFSAGFALNLLILTAKEARIDDEGLMINLAKAKDEDLVEKIPDMPERRKF